MLIPDLLYYCSHFGELNAQEPPTVVEREQRKVLCVEVRMTRHNSKVVILRNDKVCFPVALTKRSDQQKHGEGRVKVSYRLQSIL